MRRALVQSIMMSVARPGLESDADGDPGRPRFRPSGRRVESISAKDPVPEGQDGPRGPTVAAKLRVLASESPVVAADR